MSSFGYNDLNSICIAFDAWYAYKLQQRSELATVSTVVQFHRKMLLNMIRNGASGSVIPVTLRRYRMTIQSMKNIS